MNLEKDSPVIIDFVGVGGSGKTYLSKIIMDKLDVKCILASDYKLRLFDSIKHLIINPVYFFNCLIFLYRTKQKSLKSFKRSFYALSNYKVKYEVLTRKDYKAILFDEGMLHKLRQIRRRSRLDHLGYENISVKYRNMFFGYPDVVVFVYAPLETTAKRRSERKEVCCIEAETEKLNKVDGGYDMSIEQTIEDIKKAKIELCFEAITINNKGNISSTDSTIKNIVHKVTVLLN